MSKARLGSEGWRLMAGNEITSGWMLCSEGQWGSVLSCANWKYKAHFQAILTSFPSWNIKVDVQQNISDAFLWSWRKTRVSVCGLYLFESQVSKDKCEYIMTELKIIFNYWSMAPQQHQFQKLVKLKPQMHRQSLCMLGYFFSLYMPWKCRSFLWSGLMLARDISQQINVVQVS